MLDIIPKQTLNRDGFIGDFRRVQFAGPVARHPPALSHRHKYRRLPNIPGEKESPVIKSLEKTDAKKDQSPPSPSTSSNSSATAVREPVVREVKEPAKAAASKPAPAKEAHNDPARDSA